MSSWRSLSLGDGISAMPVREEIKQRFASVFTVAEDNRPAVFIRQQSDGSLHCEVTAYFSPAAEQLAIEFGAMLCAEPLRAGLELLAGDKRCWHELFAQ